MRIAVKDGEVILNQITPDQYNIIKSWNLMRWVRSEQALRGRVSTDLLDKLSTLGQLPPNIESTRQALHATAELVNRERSAEKPEALVPYPVTKSLFRHQVRGANMALITFGWIDQETMHPIRKEE